MARDVDEILKEYADLNLNPSNTLGRTLWYASLESEEQLALWSAFNESKERERYYNSACGLV